MPGHADTATPSVALDVDPSVAPAKPAAQHGLPDQAGLLAGAASQDGGGDEAADSSLEGIEMSDRNVVAAARQPAKRDLTLEIWKGTIMPIMAVEHVNFVWAHLFLPPNQMMGYGESWDRSLKPIVPAEMTLLGVTSWGFRSVCASPVITGFTFLMGIGIQLLMDSRQRQQVPPLEATQWQIDGCFSQLPYTCYQNRVASVGD